MEEYLIFSYADIFNFFERLMTSTLREHDSEGDINFLSNLCL